MESKIKSLAISQHLVLRSIPEILFSNEKSENLTELAEWSLNFEVLSEILNIELKVKDLFHKYHYDRMISSYLSSSIENEKLLKKIGENFGNEVLALYGFIISTIALNFTSSICGKIIESAIDKERRRLVLNEIKCGEKFIRSYHTYCFSESLIICEGLSKEAQKLLKHLETQTRSKRLNHINIQKTAFGIVDFLYPGYQRIIANLRKSNDFSKRLEACRPGFESWRKYEGLCIEILRYLFIPEFDTVYFQNRTEDGHQIRDAILPIARYEGFWNNIRNEFSSKNIVVEFKNVIKKAREKDSVNQLRIYLSKKTIGRFGLLFIRSKPSASLVHARKLAYQESDILILIIHDELLKKLLVCKALMGSCCELLQKEKVKFEIEF